MKTVVVGPEKLTIEQVVAVAKREALVELDSSSQFQEKIDIALGGIKKNSLVIAKKYSELMVAARKDFDMAEKTLVAKIVTSVYNETKEIRKRIKKDNITLKDTPVKININISAGDGITETDLQGATVTILNTTTGGTFNVQTGEVTANGAQAAATPITAGTLEVREDTGVQGISAIIIPQTFLAGRRFISIKYGGDQQTPATELFYTLPHGQTAGVDFAAGYSYTFNITAKKSGLTLDGSNITNWTDYGDEFSGEATPTP